MSSSTLKLAVIVGSVREGRFGPVVARWAEEQAKAHGRFAVKVIDLAETELPLALGELPPAAVAEDQYPRPAGMAPLTAALQEADAYLVVTPEYNHSFPASLKAAIDWHYTQWTAKPVGFVSYGATYGGVLAIEQLRQVFAEMHTVTARDTVTFPRYWEGFDESGQPTDPEAGPAATRLLDQLAWWAATLTRARAAEPYPAA
ncbi:NADPH-dependent FMN reductase [Streptomyces profundus]|uniref:NADPH-dependent FMN reductase n=1 Tax=Streptomyces profundus TaxID=2867410 RepID=UPI001D1609B0|nr:NAD(P)H-dependent oxidoreductase [Streptomyces sp. MA3_2.13]UED85164.1 NAD(P)H-dependent oxidoreductase [Streptomyces sp. MA3_2.13]